MSVRRTSQQIKSWALELGFDACGIAKAGLLPINSESLKTWLNVGFNANMKYMKNHLDKRTDITKLVKDAKSVIVVLSSYNPSSYPFKNKHLKISRYALAFDYHSVIKSKLNLLFEKIRKHYGKIEGRAFVDSAPLFEKAWAEKAGLGWIGKNSLLLNKNFGSFCFLGELVLNIELKYDSPVKTNCGTCNICIDSCPTNAIVSPYSIDANRCIAYNTIENKGTIPIEIKEKMNGWIYGCDICQEVCPWNNKTRYESKTEFISFEKLEAMTDSDWQNLSMENFNDFFKNSPLKRAKYERLKRNINANLNLKFN